VHCIVGGEGQNFEAGGQAASSKRRYVGPTYHTFQHWRLSVALVLVWFSELITLWKCQCS